MPENITPEQVEFMKGLIREELISLIKSDRYVFEKTIQILDQRNIQVGRTTGTKIGTNSGEKIGFLGVTPVIQQTTSSQTPASFVANSSGIVNDSATWNGYTIGDIVAILQAFGFIA
jgi:hypothetical protein